MKKSKVVNLFEPNKNKQNTEVKYATLLEHFTTPFVKYFENFEYQEDIFDFALKAWNLGNLRNIFDEDEFEELILLSKEDSVDFSLLRKMTTLKFVKFKEFTDFIIDFELETTKNEIKLTVVTEPKSSYMADLMTGASETTVVKDEFEENFINRSAISLKPLQPFINWHDTIYPDSKFDELTFNEVNIYLINNSNYEDIEAYLRKKFDRYFMMELDGWHTNKKEWPQRRNYKMFKEWFRIDISTAVYDLEKTPVSKSE
jgi:hypothetical protein